MQAHEFGLKLAAEGYTTVTPMDRPVGYALDAHAHSFDACALVTRGDITLTVEGVATNYAAGQVFLLPAGTLHHEHAGPAGVSYISGRREAAAT